MSAPIRLLRHQGANLAAVAATGVRAALGLRASGLPAFPTPPVAKRIPAPPAALVDAYVAEVGGAPDAPALPPHLFSWWAFDLMGRSLQVLPYDLSKLLNGGCALTVHRPLPRDRALHVAVSLSDVSDDDRRVLITQRIETTPEGDAEPAAVAEVRLILPKRRSKEAKQREGTAPRKDPPTAPPTATVVRRFAVSATAGRDFVVLTGDANPIHWVPAAARAAGFKGCILHGFATYARAWEALSAEAPLAHLDARFVKPLLLPGAASVLVAGDEVFVADAPGGLAYLTGTFKRG